MTKAGKKTISLPRLPRRKLHIVKDGPHNPCSNARSLAGAKPSSPAIVPCSHFAIFAACA